MRELLLVLCLFAGCGSCVEDISPVDFATAYNCSVDVSCYPTPKHKVYSEQCVANRAAAEDEAIAAAKCDGCYCIVMCEKDFPPTCLP